MKLTLTITEAAKRKRRLWSLFCTWQWIIRRAFFPDTGGHPQFLHNWYRCDSKRNPQGAKLADWIEASTWNRYRRLEAVMEKRDMEREHLRHVNLKLDNGARFDPFWCPLCHPERHP